MLKHTHSASDTVDDYCMAYGYLGRALHSAVVKLRQSTTATTTTTLSTSTTHQAVGITGGLLGRSASLTPFPQVCGSGNQGRHWFRKVVENKHTVMDFMVVSVKLWDRKCAFFFLLEPLCDSTGCGRKKWTPKCFRHFLSNCLGF